ncbi:MAG: membrane protein [bacterium]|nr:MAG: membrane protein [bacterium]
MGLGHVRRNLLIAHAVSMSRLKPDILIVSGATETHQFTLPPGVDCLTIPSLYKELDGTYRSKRLKIPLKELIAIRTNAIYSAVSAFNPDLIIVDNIPRGAFREMNPTLKRFSAVAGTHCVLGLRDIKDDADTVHREWDRGNCLEAIRKYYDEIWVYGDSDVYNPVEEYSLPADISAKIRYTGYLDQKIRLELFNKKTSKSNVGEKHDRLVSRFVLCMVGGGQDGCKLASAFVKTELSGDLSGVLLLGPHMDHELRNKLSRQAEKNPKMRIIDFHPEPTLLIKKADFVVSMFGYNSAAEILSFNKHALVVPRVAPRTEQLIRAECLSRLGVIDMLHPDKLNPQAITDWLNKKQNSPDSKCEHNIDMQGLKRIPEFIESLFASSTTATGNRNIYGLARNV